MGFENGNTFFSKDYWRFSSGIEALEIVYRENGAAVEGLVDRNEHIRKEVGEGKSVSWGVARTKGEGRECELTKNLFFHNDLLQLCLNKKRKITEFFPDTTVFYDLKTHVLN